MCVPHLRKDEKHPKWINARLCPFATYIFKLQWLISLEGSEVPNKSSVILQKGDILSFPLWRRAVPSFGFVSSCSWEVTWGRVTSKYHRVLSQLTCGADRG